MKGRCTEMEHKIVSDPRRRVSISFTKVDSRLRGNDKQNGLENPFSWLLLKRK